MTNAKHRLIVALTLCAILSGCAGARQQQFPALAPAWMTPESRSGDLLYVSDIGAQAVDVFSYPGRKLVGTLTGFDEPNGECVSASGDVFIVDTYAGEIREYAHGASKPKAELHIGEGFINCSVDPQSGNLAVIGGGSGVWVFTHAKGQAKYWSGEQFLRETYSCAYDPHGNLYVAGQNAQGQIQLAKYAHLNFALSPINLDANGAAMKVGWPGGMLWSGKYLALGDVFADKFDYSQRDKNVVYKIKIEGAYGSIQNTAGLGGAGEVAEFWIANGQVMGADAENEDVGFWKFPQGGAQLKAITGFYEPVGVVISAAPHARLSRL